jgi:hypothetical protein
MAHALDLLRLEFARRPLFLWIVLWLGMLAATSRRQARSASGRPVDLTLVSGVAILGLLGYVLLSVWYAADAHFFDDAEPTIPAIAWAVHRGQPLYHAPESPERYSHIYGPLAFLIHGWALALVGPRVLVSKALGVVAGLCSLAATYALLKRVAPTTRAAVLTGVCALELLLFRHYSFWTRPDSLQLLAVVVATACAVSRGRTATVTTGLAAGIMWNLKLTGPLYTLPAFVLLLERRGWKRASVAALIGLATAAAPFLFWSNVSFANYLFWLHASAKTGLLLTTLRENLEWACFLLVPVLLASFAVPRTQRTHEGMPPRLIAATLLGMIGVALAGAKPGAGVYHFIPFVPILAFVTAVQLQPLTSPDTLPATVRRGAVAFVAVTATIVLAVNAPFIGVMRERRALDEVPDIEHFAETHAGVVEMGYGLTEAKSLERPALVLRTGRYFLDQPAIREEQLQGLTMPAATIDALTACRVTWWLIPRGEEPFSSYNSYGAVLLQPLYPPAFREAFKGSHRLVEQTRYFDVWRCLPRSAPR